MEIEQHNFKATSTCTYPHLARFHVLAVLQARVHLQHDVIDALLVPGVQGNKPHQAVVVNLPTNQGRI